MSDFCRNKSNSLFTQIYFYCLIAAQSEILYTKRSVVAPYALQRTHAISVEEIARRVGYPECQTSWAINEMLRFSKQRFFSMFDYIYLYIRWVPSILYNSTSARNHMTKYVRVCIFKFLCRLHFEGYS